MKWNSLVQNLNSLRYINDHCSMHVFPLLIKLFRKSNPVKIGQSCFKDSYIKLRCTSLTGLKVDLKSICSKFSFKLYQLYWSTLKHSKASSKSKLSQLGQTRLSYDNLSQKLLSFGEFNFMRITNQTGDISSLDGTSLKLVDTYLGSSVSSTEKDIDTRLTKAWTAIDKLSIIWKSDLTDKMKRSFFQAAVVSILLCGCTTWTQTKRLKKKLDCNYTRMLPAILNKSWQ